MSSLIKLRIVEIIDILSWWKIRESLKLLIKKLRVKIIHFRSHWFHSLARIQEEDCHSHQSSPDHTAAGRSANSGSLSLLAAVADPALIWVSLLAARIVADLLSNSAQTLSHLPSLVWFSFSWKNLSSYQQTCPLNLDWLTLYIYLLLKLWQFAKAWANSGFMLMFRCLLSSTLIFLVSIQSLIICWIPAVSRV